MAIEENFPKGLPSCSWVCTVLPRASLQLQNFLRRISSHILKEQYLPFLPFSRSPFQIHGSFPRGPRCWRVRYSRALIRSKNGRPTANGAAKRLCLLSVIESTHSMPHRARREQGGRKLESWLESSPPSAAAAAGSLPPPPPPLCSFSFLLHFCSVRDRGNECVSLRNGPRETPRPGPTSPEARATAGRPPRRPGGRPGPPPGPPGESPGPLFRPDFSWVPAVMAASLALASCACAVVPFGELSWAGISPGRKRKAWLPTWHF